MNKRQFLKSLLLAPIGAVLTPAAAQQKYSRARRILVQNSPINGLNYYRAKDLIYLLQPGDKICMERELHDFSNGAVWVSVEVG